MDWQPRRLQAWLRDELAVDESINVLPVEGGFSNENFLITSASRRWLLRKPPVLTSHQSAHNVLREHRVLQVLQHSAVRVPRPVACCQDRSVIGTPFILMDWVAGVRLDSHQPDSYHLSQNNWQVIGAATLQQLINLHQLDWRALQLQDLGCVDGFLERQVERWMAQYRAVKQRLPQVPLNLEVLPQVAEWLQLHCPRADIDVLLHGDFHCQNLLFSRQPPIRALAVIDWELATLGDSRLDLAAVVSGFEDAGMPGYIVRDLVARYAEVIGADVSQLAYFQVLAAWKRAVILVSRFTSLWSARAANDPLLLGLQQHISLLLERAARMSSH